MSFSRNPGGPSSWRKILIIFSSPLWILTPNHRRRGTVVINHKKRDREDEEKEEGHLEDPPPPRSFLVVFFFFNFSFWQPNNTSCLREAFMAYNLRPINRWLLLTNTYTHIFLSIQTSAEILQLENISYSKWEAPFSPLHQLDGCTCLFLRLLLSTPILPGFIRISVPLTLLSPTLCVLTVSFL